MQVKKDDIQNKILTVAQRLFIKNGYENTSLKMIADRSYISKSNIYRYYRSKEDIYEALVGPARQAVVNTMSIFFTPEFIGIYSPDKCEEIAPILAKLFCEHRKGMLIALRSETGTDRKMIEQSIIAKFIEACPIDDDGTKELISKLLIYGLIEILLKYSDEENIQKHLKHLIYYHYLGLDGLKADIGCK
ncbi:transcriptional regulator, TetR family [Lachnospiraceae bacterium NE2001]|nr:transcriptional regulator, TetR family [Lachnospiraceae bacterium NE2001]